MASCVQRRERCAQFLGENGRASDQELFQQTLDNLWAAAGDSAGDDVQWSLLDQLDEVRSDEEAEGALAYSEDGVVALFYATQFVRNGDHAYVLHCASRCYDSAGFVDDLVDGSDSFADTEAQMQLDDIATLRDSLSDETLSNLRARSAAESERIYREIVRVGP